MYDDLERFRRVCCSNNVLEKII